MPRVTSLVFTEGVGVLTGKNATFEVPTSGLVLGLTTVTGSVTPVAGSAERPLTTIWLLVTLAGVSRLPLKFTLEPLTKFAPNIVSDESVEPGVAAVG